MEANLADLFEFAADTFAGREYLVAEGKRRTYAGMVNGGPLRVGDQVDVLPGGGRTT